MQYRILSKGIEIGRSDLESHDPSMGVASGGFQPSEHYRVVQNVFTSYAKVSSHVTETDDEIANAYYSARDSLQLSLMTQENVVVPTTCIHIIDFSEEMGEGEIEVMVYTDSEQASSILFSAIDRVQSYRK